MVDILVMATYTGSGTAAEKKEKLADLLGLTMVKDDVYAPLGIISMPKEDVGESTINFDGSYKALYEKILAALKDINSTKSVLNTR